MSDWVTVLVSGTTGAGIAGVFQLLTTRYTRGSEDRRWAREADRAERDRVWDERRVAYSTFIGYVEHVASLMYRAMGMRGNARRRKSRPGSSSG